MDIDPALYNQQIAQTWLTMGNDALFHSLNPEEAALDFDKALEYTPENAEIWYKKGVSMKKLGLYDESIRCFERATQIQPNIADGWYELGQLLEQGHENQKAVDSFMKVVKYDSTHFDAWIKAGTILLSMNEPQKAIRCFNAAINLRATSSVAWYNLGNALKSSGDADKAKRCYKKASDPRGKNRVNENPSFVFCTRAGPGTAGGHKIPSGAYRAFRRYQVPIQIRRLVSRDVPEVGDTNASGKCG